MPERKQDTLDDEGPTDLVNGNQLKKDEQGNLPILPYFTGKMFSKPGRYCTVSVGSGSLNNLGPSTPSQDASFPTCCHVISTAKDALA